MVKFIKIVLVNHIEHIAHLIPRRLVLPVIDICNALSFLE